MRQIGRRALWLGHAGDLRSPTAIMAAGVGAVIELADNEQFASLPRDLVRCRFPLSDSNNPAWLLRWACESVSVLQQAGVPTLICCSGGMNRSVCIAAGGLALADHCSLDESLRLVAESGPADVYPMLLAQVRAALPELSAPT